MCSITYEEYFDKVYGCMIGKCVAGTAGAPYEGMKQRLNLSFSAEEADTHCQMMIWICRYYGWKYLREKEYT